MVTTNATATALATTTTNNTNAISVLNSAQAGLATVGSLATTNSNLAAVTAKVPTWDGYATKINAAATQTQVTAI